MDASIAGTIVIDGNKWRVKVESHSSEIKAKIAVRLMMT